MAFIGVAALFLQRLGDAGLVPFDEGIALIRFHLRGGDDVNHDSLLAFLDYRTSTFSGVMYSIFGGAVMHFTATRPKVFICSALPCGPSTSIFSHCSTNTILAGSVTLSCRS